MNAFFSPQPYAQQNGIAFLRVLVGLMLVYHGWEVFDKTTMDGYAKWDSFRSFFSPALLPYAGKAGELLAGILLTAGLFTRLACLLIIAIFVYITFFVGHGKFWYEDQHPFMFVVAGLIFLFTGPGNFCMDNLICHRSKKQNR